MIQTTVEDQQTFNQTKMTHEETVSLAHTHTKKRKKMNDDDQLIQTLWILKQKTREKKKGKAEQRKERMGEKKKCSPVLY